MSYIKFTETISLILSVKFQQVMWSNSVQRTTLRPPEEKQTIKFLRNIPNETSTCNQSRAAWNLCMAVFNPTLLSLSRSCGKGGVLVRCSTYLPLYYQKETWLYVYDISLQHFNRPEMWRVAQRGSWLHISWLFIATYLNTFYMTINL